MSLANRFVDWVLVAAEAMLETLRIGGCTVFGVFVAIRSIKLSSMSGFKDYYRYVEQGTMLCISWHASLGKTIHIDSLFASTSLSFTDKFSDFH